MSRFIDACWQRPVDRIPVWFMRQAGRYMPEYRQLRTRYSMLELCKSPELAAQVTLQPMHRFDFDAAIIFADLLLPFEALGVPFEFAKGEGPVIHNPVRTRRDVCALRDVEPRESLAYVLEAIRIVRRELGGSAPLIGFAGAPYTLASYLIEGGGSRNYVETKRLMYSDPESWHLLMEKLAKVSADFLRAQVEAGAEAVQLFDSWVGALSPADYRRYVLPHTRSVFDALRDLDVPRIHFGTGTASLLELVKEAGGDVIGLDWHIELDAAWKRLGSVAVQGNLDPTVLFAPPEIIREQIAGILTRAGGRRGHIFNLGHGILPGTPEEHVELAVNFVHEWSNRDAEARRRSADGVRWT
jgi:uroporphyrinogen decarboxylase